MKELWAGTPSIVPVGLINVGNTCYLAAVLQALCASVNVAAYAGVEVLCTEPSCDKCRLASLVLTALRSMSSGCPPSSDILTALRDCIPDFGHGPFTRKQT
jgi:uncharacterized UBP type Zn finger protein